jgi:CHAD domain-containing protein
MDRSAPREHLIAQRLRTLESTLPAAVRGDTDALHKARIATRRIREALPLLSSADKVRRLERKIRRITRALGPIRELDVAMQILDDVEKSGDLSRSALTRLRQAVARERQVLQADMKRQVERCNLVKLRKRAIGVARKAAGSSVSRTDPARLARARLRAARRGERLRAAIEGASGIYLPDRLHDVRIAVKKLRYALELVGELSGSTPGRSASAGAKAKAMKAQLKILSKAQDALGRMHDLEILIARTRAVQGAPGAPTLKLSGELDRLVRRFETECRQLHGVYMASRRALLEISDRAIASSAASARAA